MKPVVACRTQFVQDPGRVLLTGLNQGTLDGTSFSFQGVQTVAGGNQVDGFTFQTATAALSGGIQEPAGGNLSLGGPTVTLEGTIITHGGSVSVNDSTVINNGNSVTLQGNIFTQGGALTVFADTITLNDQANPG